MPFVGSTLVPERRERSLLFFSRYELLVCLRLVAMRETKKLPLSSQRWCRGREPWREKTLYLTACLPKVPTVFFHPFLGVYMYHPSIHPSLPVCARVCVGVIYWCVMIKKNR